MFQLVEMDCRSNTGKNLRKLSKITDKHHNRIGRSELQSLEYKEVPANEKWKIMMAKELIDVKAGLTCVPSWSSKAIDEILNFITT